MCRLPPQNYDLRIKFIPHPGPEVWKADEVGYDFPRPGALAIWAKIPSSNRSLRSE